MYRIVNCKQKMEEIIEQIKIQNEQGYKGFKK